MTDKLQNEHPDDIEKLGLVYNFSIYNYLDRRSEERLQQMQAKSPLLRQLSSRFNRPAAGTALKDSLTAANAGERKVKSWTLA